MKISRITTHEFDDVRELGQRGLAKARITSYHWFPIKKTALKFQRHFNSLLKKLEKAELTFRDSSHCYYGRGRSLRELRRDFKRDYRCHPASKAIFEVLEVFKTGSDICDFLNEEAYGLPNRGENWPSWSPINPTHRIHTDMAYGDSFRSQLICKERAINKQFESKRITADKKEELLRRALRKNRSDWDKYEGR